MMLKPQYEGYLSAAPLQLVLIAVIQKWEDGKAVVEWVAVKGETCSICSQLSCAGGKVVRQ
jgi:hypothetical protein